MDGTGRKQPGCRDLTKVRLPSGSRISRCLTGLPEQSYLNSPYSFVYNQSALKCQINPQEIVLFNPFKTGMFSMNGSTVRECLKYPIKKLSDE